MIFNGLIPELTVTDLATSLRFYVELLGFEIEYDRPEDKFAFLSRAAAQVMLEEGDGNGKWANGKLERPFGRGLNFQINVEGVEAIAARLIRTGHPLKIPLEEISYRRGDQAVRVRQCLVLDPDGYLLRLAQLL